MKYTISEEFITLANLLKVVGTAQTGGHAKLMIQQGLVKLNDNICTQRGKKLIAGDRVSIDMEGEIINIEVAD